MEPPTVVEEKLSPDTKEEHLYACLGEVIRERRKALALSQSQLASGTGIDRAFLSNLERGQRKPSFGRNGSIHGFDRGFPSSTALSARRSRKV